ncbi:MAG: hypothetical protein GX219_07930 [Tissierellia bacterium]|nr:hypothetical protein [Tissierellia bacterium]
MEIKRIDGYDDKRFNKSVLEQHGCFLVGDAPYEVEIISDYEALVRGEDTSVYEDLIDEFSFYSPHITCFYDDKGKLIKELPKVSPFNIRIEDIQPSQFFVSKEKLRAVGNFINRAEDIIIPVLPYEGRYISLDGHTRLFYGITRGWESVRAVVDSSDDYIYDFVEEGIKLGIKSPRDMILLSQEDYEVRWNKFCDEFFEKYDTEE